MTQRTSPVHIDDESYKERLARLRRENRAGWAYYHWRHGIKRDEQTSATSQKNTHDGPLLTVGAVLLILIVAGLTLGYLIMQPTASATPSTTMDAATHATLLIHDDIVWASTNSAWVTDAVDAIDKPDTRGNVGATINLGTFRHMTQQEIQDYRPLQEACFAINGAVWTDMNLKETYGLKELRLTITYTQPDGHTASGGCTLTSTQGYTLNWSNETAQDMWEHHYYTAFTMPPN